MEGNGFGQYDGNPVADFHSVAGFGGMAVDLDPLLADQRLDARAGEVGKAGREARLGPRYAEECNSNDGRQDTDNMNQSG